MYASSLFLKKIAFEKTNSNNFFDKMYFIKILNKDLKMTKVMFLIKKTILFLKKI